MYRLSISTMLDLRGVGSDSVCVFENSFYSLNYKHVLILESNCFFEGDFNVWC